MQPTVVFGRIRGIPLGAHWSALGGIALLATLLATTVLPFLAPGHGLAAYALTAAATAVAFGLSLLAHEVAHALVALRSGMQVQRITLWLLGGVSELRGNAPGPGVEMRVAAAGPLTSLGLGTICTALAVAGTGPGWTALVTAPLSWLGAMNLVIGVFNLLPGTPLDGGRLLHGLIWRWTGDRGRATRDATGAGRLLGAVLAGVGVVLVITGRWDGLWLVLVGWFIGGSAQSERAHATIVESLAGLTVGTVMTTAPVVVPGSWSVQALLEHLGAPDGARHRVFPVVDPAGRPEGVVGLADLAGLTPEARRRTAVRAVLHAPALVLAPTDPLERVLERPPVAGRDLVVVADGGRVVGVLGAGDLERVVVLRSAIGPPSTL